MTKPTLPLPFWRIIDELTMSNPAYFPLPLRKLGFTILNHSNIPRWQRPPLLTLAEGKAKPSQVAEAKWQIYLTKTDQQHQEEYVQEGKHPVLLHPGSSTFHQFRNQLDHIEWTRLLPQQRYSDSTSFDHFYIMGDTCTCTSSGDCPCNGPQSCTCSNNCACKGCGK
ncbi:hypothetical protein V6Z92_005430 [Aspergillus fumigatus]